MIKLLYMHIRIFPEWTKIITSMCILNIFSPLVWKKVLCYGNLNTDPRMFSPAVSAIKVGGADNNNFKILSFSWTDREVRRSSQILGHILWGSWMSSHCHHSIWTNRTSSSSCRKPAWIGLKDVFHLEKHMCIPLLVFRNLSTEPSTNRLSSATNFTAQIIRDSVSFKTSRYQGDSSSIHVIVSTLPPLQCCVCYKIWHKQTSQCATLSFGHLNVWGSKIISIYIIHNLISYGSSFNRLVYKVSMCTAAATGTLLL